MGGAVLQPDRPDRLQSYFPYSFLCPLIQPAWLAMGNFHKIRRRRNIFVSNGNNGRFPIDRHCLYAYLCPGHKFLRHNNAISGIAFAVCIYPVQFLFCFPSAVQQNHAPAPRIIRRLHDTAPAKRLYRFLELLPALNRIVRRNRHMVFFQPLPHMTFYCCAQRVLIGQIRFLAQFFIDIGGRPHRSVAGGGDYDIGAISQCLAVYLFHIERADHQLYIRQRKTHRIFIIIHENNLISQFFRRMNRRNLERAPA